jgi:putative DNA primase/helicase
MTRGSWNTGDLERPKWGPNTASVAKYDYRRADGTYSFTVEKGINTDSEKCFRTWRQNLMSFGDRLDPEDKADTFSGMGDEKAIPYRLPELIAAMEKQVLITEGEKDCETAVELGYVATTNPFGALKWKDEFSPYLKNRDVIVIADNDDRGRQHADRVVVSISGHASSIKVLQLPAIFKDLTEWKEARAKSVRSKEDIKSELDKLISRAVEKFAVGDDHSAPPFSEEALALNFAALHAADMRYVAKWNKWFRWDGARWKEDDTRMVFSLSRSVCREAASRINRPKEAKAIATAKTRAAVISLAGEDRRLAATMDQWDSDPWLLNTPGGIVDLKTGAILAAAPEKYMTKITAVAPGGDCPLWHSFLKTVTGNDEELEKYLQRVGGYSLTGTIDEHAMFFNHGKGGNGKTVYMNAISGVLGDYHCTTPMEALTASNVDRHPTELARLLGARLVTAIETEVGRRWAESRIKMLTGGEGKIPARFMRQDFFEYRGQFKLWISGNHKPGLRAVDEAIRRRMNLIPWLVTISEKERDKEFGEKLKIEWPGILAWMIAGCLEWQSKGLRPPSSVVEATNAYLDEEDVFKSWLEDCIRRDKSQWSAYDQLFLSWERYAKGHGEFVGSGKDFQQRLQGEGFKRHKKSGRGYLGLTIYRAEPETTPENGPPPRREIYDPPL